MSQTPEGPWQSPHFLTQKHLSVLCMRCISSLAVCLLTEGKLDVTKDGLKVLTIEPEDMFGELALLYNCTHTYSVSGIKAPCWLLGFVFACRYHWRCITPKHWWSFNCISFLIR